MYVCMVVLIALSRWFILLKKGVGFDMTNMLPNTQKSDPNRKKYHGLYNHRI